MPVDDAMPIVLCSLCGNEVVEYPPPIRGVAPAPIDGEGYIDDWPAGESGPRANGLRGRSSRVKGGGNWGLKAGRSLLESFSASGGSALVFPAPRGGKSRSTGLLLNPSRDEFASLAMRMFSCDSTFSSTGEAVPAEPDRFDTLSGVA